MCYYCNVTLLIHTKLALIQAQGIKISSDSVNLTFFLFHFYSLDVIRSHFNIQYLFDRYPWGKEAFDMAKTENKPIFLSGICFILYW